MKALRWFDSASQPRARDFDDAYRELQAAIVDVSDLSERAHIETPALVELGGNPFPDFHYERVQQAFTEGATLRREALRRRRRRQSWLNHCRRRRRHL
jgi:hypothetical protein